MDNQPADVDYFARQMMNPNGFNGAYYGVGGKMRERPLPRSVSSDPNWRIRDMEDDVNRASDIGLDCFFFSVCTIGKGTQCWDEMTDLLAASNNLGGQFKIVPMMDIASFNNAGRTPTAVATSIASIADDGALMRDASGRLYISATNGDKWSVDKWLALKRELAARGVTVSLVPTLQTYSRSRDDYLPIVDGIGTMGVGTPLNAVGGTAARAKEAHDLGKIFIAGIKSQDFRPYKGWYTEARNFDLFRDHFEDAIAGNADWLMINSWNDREEHHEIAPSTGIQWGFYDLAAYYITWFKQREAPAITRDVLFYNHRIMWTNTPYNHAKQPKPIIVAPWESDQPAANDIELLAFLTKPGRLLIRSNNTDYATDAPAGITSFRAPLGLGYPQFWLFRDGQSQIRVNSPFQVRNTTTWQDFFYRTGSSARSVVDMVANPPVTD